MRIRSRVSALVVAWALLVGIGVAGIAQADEPAGLLGESEASALAVAEDRPVEVSALTSETMLVVAKPDGTFSAEVSLVPERVRAGSGWADVNRSLALNGKGRFAAKSAPSVTSVSDGGTDPLVRVEDGESFFELRWVRPLPIPTISGDTAVYAEVVPGVDLVAVSGDKGFSTYWVVKTPEAAAGLDADLLSFTWTASAGLTVRAQGTELEVVTSSGEVVFASAGLAMWDSANVPDDFHASKDVVRRGGDSKRTSLTPQITGDRLFVGVDPGYWTQPGLVFPVVIDPSVSRTDTNWLMVWSNGLKFWNSQTENARVGFDGWSGNKTSRAFYQFSMTGLGGKHIKAASLTARQVHSPGFTCAPATDANSVDVYRTGDLSSAMSWSTQPAWLSKLASNTQVSGNSTTCIGGIDQKWDVTAGVQTQATASAAWVSLGLRSANESDRNGWRQYDNTTTAYSSYPKLTIEFYGTPDVPTNLKITNPANYTVDVRQWTTSGHLHLRADVKPETVPADATKDASVRAFFRITNVATGQVHSASAAASQTVVGASTVTFPAPGNTPLPDGQYRVAAMACSNDVGGWRCSAYTAERVVTIDTVAPGLPTLTMKDDAGQIAEAIRVGTYWRTTVALPADAVKFDYTFIDIAGGKTKGTITGGSTLQVAYTAPGRYWLEVQAIDAAGNKSAVVTVSMKMFGESGYSLKHQYLMDPVAGGAGSSQQVLDQGGVNSLPLDQGNAGTSHFGTGTRPGCLAPSSTFSPGGAVNTYLRAAASPALETNSPFSMTVWIKPSTDDVKRALAGHDVTYVWGMSGSTPAVSTTTIMLTRYEIAPGQYQARWKAVVAGTEVMGAFAVELPNSEMGDADPPWYAVGITKDVQKNVSLFVDGQDAVIVAAGPDTTWTSSTVWIGVGSVPGISNPPSFTGMVDDLRLFEGDILEQNFSSLTLSCAEEMQR